MVIWKNFIIKKDNINIQHKVLQQKIIWIMQIRLKLYEFYFIFQKDMNPFIIL